MIDIRRSFVRNGFVWGLIAALLAVHAVILHVMGRIPACVCGIGLWTPNTWANDTSQHFADPYSLSHVLHGIIFFAVLTLIARRSSIRARLVVSVLIEIAWEILENSPIIISRYREATASQDYQGDSILNSLGDIGFVLLGFWIAYRLRWQWTLLVVVAIELAMLALYRDNLTLNVIMLAYPIEAIREWQVP